MKIIIAGGTGFIGRYLIAALLSDQHEISVLSRDAEKVRRLFGLQVAAVNWDQINQLDASQFNAVINLTGQNIGERRWTDAVKQAIKASRVDTTKLLAQWCAATKNPPHL